MTHCHVGRRRQGSVLIGATILASLLLFICLGIFSLGSHWYRTEFLRVNSVDAYYHAENILLLGADIINKNETVPVGDYSLAAQNLDLPYTLRPEVEAATLTISEDPTSDQHFKVASSATVRGRTRSLEGIVQKGPPSRVFDYVYFLNNWGWMFGGFHLYGDLRSNWDFTIKDRPSLWGHVFARNEVLDDKKIWRPGQASPANGHPHNSGKPHEYLHSAVSPVSMAHLKDFTYYENQAVAREGKIRQKDADDNLQTIVDAVHGAEEGQLPGLYLEGTVAKPLEIEGTVVVRGDVIIKGVITGQGTLYVGGNLYVADNVTYAQSPNYAKLQTAMKIADPQAQLVARNAWVDASMEKDLVAFAVKNHILMGDVTRNNFYNTSYNNGTYGMKLYGSEYNLGPDGIRGTGDEKGGPFDPFAGQTDVPDNAWWFDVNNNGLGGDPDDQDAKNYDLRIDVGVDRAGNDANNDLTHERKSQIQGYPTSGGNLRRYADIATGSMQKFQGILYTEHASAHYTNKLIELNGSLICRDEAWVIGNNSGITYDDRIHSRHHKQYYEGNPNRIIDLGLPIAEGVRFVDRYEVQYQ